MIPNSSKFFFIRQTIQIFEMGNVAISKPETIPSVH